MDKVQYGYRVDVLRHVRVEVRITRYELAKINAKTVVYKDTYGETLQAKSGPDHKWLFEPKEAQKHARECVKMLRARLAEQKRNFDQSAAMIKDNKCYVVHPEGSKLSVKEVAQRFMKKNVL